MKGNKPGSVRRFVLKPKETEKLSQPRVHLHNYMVLLCFRKTQPCKGVGREMLVSSPWHCAHGHGHGEGESQGITGNHLCAGSAVPWAWSQRWSNRDSWGISSVWGRKMICSCSAASRECRTPFPCSRLKILSWLVLSKSAQGEDSPKT